MNPSTSSGQRPSASSRHSESPLETGQRPSPVWRLLQTGAGAGAWNMALDEAMLRLVGQGKSPPTLRLYWWQPACLSVGYFQAARREVDLARLAEAGIDLVRRPSGGRAILHDRELTYSVVASLDDPLVSGGVAQSYGKLAAGLLAALKALGVTAQAALQDRRGNGVPRSAQDSALRQAQDSARSPACFATTSHYELTVGGRKVVGSAQMRQGGVLLQHGSVLLGLDEAKFAQLLHGGDAAKLSQHATCLEEVLGRPIALEEVARAMAQGFSQALGITLIAEEPTPEELALAQRLLEEKYATPEWNLRR